MTAILDQILTEWGRFFTSGTLVAGWTLGALILLGAMWLALIVPAPRGPLLSCRCGWHTRQGGGESHAAYRRRTSAHFDDCAATS